MEVFLALIGLFCVMLSLDDHNVKKDKKESKKSKKNSLPTTEYLSNFSTTDLFKNYNNFRIPNQNSLNSHKYDSSGISSGLSIDITSLNLPQIEPVIINSNNLDSSLFGQINFHDNQLNSPIHSILGQSQPDYLNLLENLSNSRANLNRNNTQYPFNNLTDYANLFNTNGDLSGNHRQNSTNKSWKNSYKDYPLYED